MPVLTPVILGFEYADIMERIKATSGSVYTSETCRETRNLLLERMIRPLLEHTDFEAFHPSVRNAQSLLSSGHLRNVREVEVMLLAHTHVSTSVVEHRHFI